MKIELGSDGFRQIFDTAPDAMLIVDDQGRIVLANQQVERLFGFAHDELLSQTIEILVPRRYRETHIHDRTKFTSAPDSRAMGSGLELYGTHRDGTEFPVEISLSPVSVAQGTFVAASIRDVTLQRQLQAKTNRLQQDLLSAIDSIEGSFFIWDADDRLVVSNSQARLLWAEGLNGSLNGRTWREVMNANLESRAFDLEGSSLDDYRERLSAYHAHPTGAFSAKTHSGRSVRLVERRTPEGGTVGLITDVTDDMKREQELQQARAEAEAASSAKSEFLSSMSHELRTPLNAVLGFAQLLQRDKKTPLSPRQLERIEHVLRGGEHLLRLIDDVLDLARVEARRTPVSVEPVSVARVLEEVRMTMASIAERASIQIEVASPGDLLPDVSADRTRLKQILTNFTSNAIKYGRNGGHVKLAAEHLKGVVRVSVKDDGLGIAAEQQGKVFEPFHRAGQESGPIEGTGIGLTISQRLAELMGGGVGFNSELGQGSEFWVEFPVHLDNEAQQPSREPPASRGQLGSNPEKRLIVYVEDNPSNLAFMGDLMGDFENVQLMTATSAEAGIHLIREKLPAVVIMDINLPGMSGIEALWHLQQWPETRHIPVIALSAAAMVGEARRIERAGFTNYLTKPVRINELTDVLGKLLT